MLEYNDLLDMLDLETAEDFQYFENLADLTEAEEGYDNEILYEFFSQVNADTLGNLLEEYFEDVLSGVPEEEADLYTLMTSVKMALTSLAGAISDDESKLISFVDEYVRFRMWYIFDSEVTCHDSVNGDTIISVRDALTNYRVDKLDGITNVYDFSMALDYEIDEYVVNFTAGVISENADGYADGYDDGDEDDFDQFTSGKEKEGLLKTDFLYDDEFRDEY